MAAMWVAPVVAEMVELWVAYLGGLLVETKGYLMVDAMVVD